MEQESCAIVRFWKTRAIRNIVRLPIRHLINFGYDFIIGLSFIIVLRFRKIVGG